MARRSLGHSRRARNSLEAPQAFAEAIVDVDES
jgi:hypothetical protein